MTTDTPPILQLNNVEAAYGAVKAIRGVSLSVATRHAGVSINDLTDPERVDPLTGAAAFSGVPVEVAPREA